MRLGLIALALLAPPLCAAQEASTTARPKLVVVVSIDQFRADYLERFSAFYLPAKTPDGVGGFRYLVDQGTTYLDAHHGHVPTFTGPGHATLLTGSEPSLNGIVANDWYDPQSIDWSADKRPESVYCVQDPTVQAVGDGGQMSPRNLRVTTVGDELKMATNGRSKVVGIAFKDRASILMAGHSADTVVWSNGKGGWCSSSFYCPSLKLPAWVDALNKEKPFDAWIGKTWEPLLPTTAYALTRKAPAEKDPPEGRAFAHPLGNAGDRAYYGNLTTSGFGNDIVAQAVERAVVAEKLGQDDVPDVLVVNLSSNDYVGHRYGPNSPEVMDVSVRTDRMLSRVLNFLDKSVPGGLAQVTVVVTADHGVLPIVEESADTYRTGVVRLPDAKVEVAVDEALSARFGRGKWCWFSGPNLYLNRLLALSKGVSEEEAQKAAAAAAMTVSGVYAALTRSQLWSNQTPALDWAQMAVRSFNPRLSGDVLVFEGPGDYFGLGTGTGHGSPWAYDSHVPIVVCGKGVRHGRVSERVFTADIAPTLSHLVGTEYPTGCMGRVLPAALKGASEP